MMPETIGMDREPKPLHLLKAGECKYALSPWDKKVIGGYLFCGAPAPSSLSYCAAHQAQTRMCKSS
jgi:hypothetical protein